ncbi:MAG: tRNA lysidine(34) synthetase TilS [Candidatus Sericytochromatia bacterium]|nr:tRNA lysidine(34) synthetase TilS [Candidatus Sericytochromatia bacterium]
MAVSGGFDSVVLLDLFIHLKKLFHISFSIAHVNYNLRGQYSTDEELYVKSLSELYGLKFYSISVNLNQIIKEKKDSLENVARNIRYDFFEKISLDHKYNKIVVAHNANDQAETVLLKLIRGSISGLKGIESKRLLSQCSKIEVIRPILCISREQIIKYCKANNLQPKTDLSNLENIYQRNRVRNTIIPILIEENNNFLDLIQQTTKVISQEDKYLEKIAEKEYQNVLIKKEISYIILDHKKVIIYEECLQRRIFKYTLQELTGDINSFAYKSLEAIKNSIKKGDSNKLIELTNNYFFIKSKNKLIFSYGKFDDF